MTPTITHKAILYVKSTDTVRRTVAQERRNALIFPREHGAWGILLIPLASGACVALLRGGRGLPVVQFLLVALTLFWMRTPVESWFGAGPLRAQSQEEFRLVRRVTLILAGSALLLLTMLFAHRSNASLLILGGVAAAAFLGQAVLNKAGRKTRVLAQIVGAIGLTCTAPSAFYVSTGKLGAAACGLWLANWIFAANQVLYVQMRIRGARVPGLIQKCQHGASFLEAHVAAIGLLLLAVRLGWLPVAAMLAFVPVLVRGLAWFFGKPETLSVHRLGWMEMVQALVFGTILVAILHF